VTVGAAAGPPRAGLRGTGRFGFRSYDVSDPAKPKLLDSFQPDIILGDAGY
jgi:hypothetical protein